MPNFYITECSKCGERKETIIPTRPDGWVHADIEIQKPVSNFEQEFDWCPGCWNKIKQVIPR